MLDNRHTAITWMGEKLFCCPLLTLTALDVQFFFSALKLPGLVALLCQVVKSVANICEASCCKLLWFCNNHLHDKDYIKLSPTQPQRWTHSKEQNVNVEHINTEHLVLRKCGHQKEHESWVGFIKIIGTSSAGKIKELIVL